MKPLIVANWKMNPITLKEAEKLFVAVRKGVRNIKNAKVVICPPFPYLALAACAKGKIQIGAQDVFWEEKGAFTGEVSSGMLKDVGCQYVIIGHSERRKYQKETDVLINKKVKAVLAKKLKLILCIETKSQLGKGLRGIPAKDLGNVVVAYEPVFAIGTGNPCSPEKAGRVRILIEKTIGRRTPVLYGGSVNSQNARIFIEKAGFQGLLIGGASLNSGEFLKIIRSVDFFLRI